MYQIDLFIAKSRLNNSIHMVEAPKTINIINSAYLEAPFPKNNIFVVLASENNEY